MLVAYRYALITESGAQIPFQRALPGLYTVTYSPKTGMPVSVEPYDSKAYYENVKNKWLGYNI